MGQIIIKQAPDRDEYVIWSTIVEAPIAFGPGIHMREWVEQRRDANDYSTEVRFARADRHGSSALYSLGRWDDDNLIYEQRGYLRRADLYHACELIEDGRDSEVYDMMTPFEDLTEVRRD